jgi:hypothetical protein
MASPTITTTTTISPRKRNHLSNKSQIGSTYDAAFIVLKRLNNITLPQSMNRITANGNIKIFLVKNQLIKEVSPEVNLREEYLTYRYIIPYQ